MTLLDQSSSLPLDGIRVVALEQAVAAPLCSRHLGDLGAEVVKVERPGGGDFARRYDSVVHGESAYYVWLNRGKRSVVADLQSDDGRAFMNALLARADVFVHNLGPGAIERLGYGWNAIHARWPSLIDCAISGFGQDGPQRDRKAFDLLLQAESGLASVTGTPEEPVRVGISIADISAGMYGLAAILAALVERERTGAGVFLDIAMLDALAEWMSVPALYEHHGGAAPGRAGLHHASIAPYGPYATGDGITVLVAVHNEGQWERFCRDVLGQSSLATDARFATNQDRVARRAELDAAIASALAHISGTELLRRLEAADVPAATLNGVNALLGHPQLVARGRWRSIGTPTGDALAAAPPLGWPARAGAVAALGEHTEAVRSELGLHGAGST